MDKEYNILWIDDEHDDVALKPFIIQAESKGIILEGYGSFKEGFKALESNINNYDVILLDALFFEDETSETPNPAGLGSSIQKIIELKNKKVFPYFVLSGQTHFTEVKNPILEMFKLRCYNKKNASDVKDLLNDIIKEADNQQITQLKFKYPNAFAVCEDNYLDSKHFDRVLQVVKDIESPEYISNQQDALLPMRKLIEAIFKKLNKLGLIPDEIQNGKGAINGASIFLAGNNKDYNYKAELMHPVITESIWHILNLTQDAAHDNGHKLGADLYLSNTSNTYLYQSLCYSLLEVLDYIKPFIDDNSNKILNLAKWELIQTETYASEDWIPGTISRVAENMYGTFQPNNGEETLGVVPIKMKEFSLGVGDNIEIITKPSPCGTKTHIKEIKKL